MSAIWPCQKAATVGTDCSGRSELRELRHQRLVLVDIDLDQTDAAAGGLGDAFKGWRQCLARAAPGRPEVDQHRHGTGSLDDILHEGALVTVDDHACAIRSSPCLA